MALILQAFVIALTAHNGIDGFQKFREGKFFILKNHASRFDAAHIQNIVDETQQMFCRGIDLFQIIPGRIRDRRIIQCDIIQSDNGVHRCSYFMTHVGKEYRLGFIGFFGCRQCITEGLTLFFQLLLKKNALFQFFLFSPHLRFDGFGLQRQFCVFPVLRINVTEHTDQHERGKK